MKRQKVNVCKINPANPENLIVVGTANLTPKFNEEAFEVTVIYKKNKYALDGTLWFPYIILAGE